MNADLHCHSHYSDGTLTPAALARRAHTNGVTLWALTDHDTLDGLAEAAQTAALAGLRWLSGVEISISFLNETVHMVGLGIDPTNACLLAGLQTTRAGRDQRARAMAEGLARVGIANAYQEALRYAGNPALISRAHFARFMVERGICKDMGSVFHRYLTPGKPGYVPHAWAKLEDATAWVHGAGGVCVLAHPGRYRYSAAQEMQLIQHFTHWGGQAIEVLTSNHTPADVQKYARLATEHGLYASCGSDFHSPTEGRRDLGQLGTLPEGCRPVWELFA